MLVLAMLALSFFYEAAQWVRHAIRQRDDRSIASLFFAALWATLALIAAMVIFGEAYRTSAGRH